MLGVCALGACDGKVRVDPDMKIDSGSEANIEHPEYLADTLRWVREGRAVVFQGQNWTPVGATIAAPMVREVGEFEGMKLYTTSEQSPPFDRLLFPTTNGWQVLQPGTAVPGGDSAAAASGSNARPVRTDSL